MESRLFKSYALQARIRLNYLKTSLRFPCLGLNPIIDFISLLVTLCKINIILGNKFKFAIVTVI